MDGSSTRSTSKPCAMRAGEGEGVWFPDALVAVETEAFHELEGTTTVSCGDVHGDVGPGDSMPLPRGIPHAFSVSSSGPAQFVRPATDIRAEG